MPVCWSHVALIYLFNTPLFEGLFGQVQHAGQGWNSCHWIESGGGGDKERQMREGRWGALGLSGCHVMYISHKSPSQGDAEARICISFAGCFANLVLISPTAMFISSPGRTLK